MCRCETAARQSGGSGAELAERAASSGVLFIGVWRPEIADAAGPPAEGQQLLASACRQHADAVSAARRAVYMAA